MSYLDSDEAHIDKSRLVFPQLGRLYQTLSPLSYALMRFFTGIILLPHGVAKLLFGGMEATAKSVAGRGIPYADAWAFGAMFIELVPALCLCLGLFTRPAAALVAAEMLCITFYFNWDNGYWWNQR